MSARMIGLTLHGTTPSEHATKQPSHDSLQEHVKREKAVMAEMACEFIVALVAAFQDAHHLYLLQEAVMGGEFFTYMQARPGCGGLSCERRQQGIRLLTCASSSMHV